jgi:peroxiredoxin
VTTRANPTRPRATAPKPRRGGAIPSRPPGRRVGAPLAVAAGVVLILVLFAVWRHGSHPAAPRSASSAYQVGTPGVGATAPTFTLPGSNGQQVNLAGYRGKTVLLYFQEGLTCEPCWKQIQDLEKASASVHAAGIDQVLSITTDPANLIKQKTVDEGISTPVLSDPSMAVSKTYHANSYGMMGDSRDGHTFILVDPNGVIRWRADYGGAPRYTMYVAPAQLLTDLKTATGAG